MQFPERLIQLRTQRGLSQEELAAALNVSRQTIGKWENGQVQPELPGLLAISRFFAISLDALVKGGCCELSAPAISPDADFVAFLCAPSVRPMPRTRRRAHPAVPAPMICPMWKEA